MESDKYKALIEQHIRRQSLEMENKKKKEEERRKEKRNAMANELKKILVKEKEKGTKELEKQAQVSVTVTVTKEEKTKKEKDTNNSKKEKETNKKEKKKKGKEAEEDKEKDKDQEKEIDKENDIKEERDEETKKRIKKKLDALPDESKLKGCTSVISSACDKVVKLTHLENEEITPAHISRFVEDEIRICYDSFDINGNEDLSISEMISAFRFFGLDDVNTDDVNAVIQAFADTSKDGLSYLDFRSEMYDVICDGTNEDHIRMVFNLIDTEETGLIGQRQLLRLFSKLGILLTQTELEEVMQEMVLPKDGLVNYEKFKAFCLATDPMLKLKERMNSQKDKEAAE